MKNLHNIVYALEDFPYNIVLRPISMSILVLGILFS